MTHNNQPRRFGPCQSRSNWPLTWRRAHRQCGASRRASLARFSRTPKDWKPTRCHRRLISDATATSGVMTDSARRPSPTVSAPRVVAALTSRPPQFDSVGADLRKRARCAVRLQTAHLRPHWTAHNVRASGLTAPCAMPAAKVGNRQEKGPLTCRGRSISVADEKSNDVQEQLVRGGAAGLPACAMVTAALIAQVHLDRAGATVRERVHRSVFEPIRNRPRWVVRRTGQHRCAAANRVRHNPTRSGWLIAVDRSYEPASGRSVTGR